MKTIYVDMDGTIVEFDKNATEDELKAKGFFENRPPMRNMVGAVERLIDAEELFNYDVRILTSVFEEEHCREEKRKSVEKLLPRLKNKIVFVPIGANKSDYIDKSDKNFLLDDYSKNLHLFSGIGIKVLNGINHTHKSWKSFCVNAFDDPDDIFEEILRIVLAA